MWDTLGHSTLTFQNLKIFHKKFQENFPLKIFHKKFQENFPQKILPRKFSTKNPKKNFTKKYTIINREKYFPTHVGARIRGKIFFFPFGKKKKALIPPLGFSKNIPCRILPAPSLFLISRIALGVSQVL